VTIQFPQVDWATLIPNLVALFFGAVGDWLNQTLKTAFSSAWNSGANVLGHTPLDMTWNLGPISASINDIEGAARAVLVFALVLLGIRGMLGAVVPSQPDMLGEGVNGILGAVVLTAAFPVLIPQLIELVNQAASTIAQDNLAGYLTTIGGGISDPLIQGVLFIVLLFFVLRLIVKAVWRIGYLAVMLPVGMAACLLWAVPQTRWILGWWSRSWGGMLVAQLPSTLALAIGVGLATTAGGGLGGFAYSIAFLQLAYDLYDIIPTGLARSQSSPLGAALGAASLARLVGGLGGGGAVGAAAEAIPTNRLTTMADMYGYD
jgi:hypothetical protein